jgi:MYXO-CTERM domain-containing protein
MFTKMQVDVPISAVVSDAFSTGPAICSGDSGGPAFLAVNNQPVIAGVVSGHSIQACGGTAGYVRVDLYAAWIQQQIDLAQTNDAGPPPVDGGGSDASPIAEAGSDGDGGTTTTTSSGGCAMSARRSDASAIAVLLALAYIAARRRRVPIT